MERLLVKISYNSYRQSSTKFTVTSTIKKLSPVMEKFWKRTHE